jgi:hypothetical protein
VRGVGGTRIEVPRLRILVVLALTLCIAAPAQADVGERIILRCTHNESLAGFSQSAYEKALKELSADTEEYSDCSSLIRRAQQLAAGGSHGPGAGTGSLAASGGAIPATPAEAQALTRAAHVDPGPVSLAGAPVRPGVIHASSALSTLPTPLLATLAFLLAAVLFFASHGLRKRLRDRRSG